MSIELELQKIGLSEKEAKVYLAALELGQASVQNIALKAGVNRATTYTILESLIEKGLCSTYEEGKKTFFIASSPEYLLSLFEIKKKEIEENKGNFSQLLPELHSIHNRQKDKPVIKFFEGKQGILNCIDEFMRVSGNKDEPSRMLYNKDLLERIFSEPEREQYRQFRLKKKVRTKVLYNYVAGELRSTPDGTRVKVGEKEFPFNSDIAFYGDYIRLASLGKKLSAVLIKDREIAGTLKSLFDLAWEAALIRDVERKKKRQEGKV